MSLEFSWDSRKELANWRKHAVRFAEAMTVFADPLARIFHDPDHSVREQREIIIGHSATKQLLLVVFTERVADTIRIISARRATATERHDYEENASQ